MSALTQDNVDKIETAIQAAADRIAAKVADLLEGKIAEAKAVIMRLEVLRDVSPNGQGGTH